MKKWAKYLAAAGIPALVILLTLQGGDEISDGVGLSLVNMTVSQKDSVVRAEISSAKIGDEIVSMRSATAKTRKLGNNKFNARVYSAPQHYLDEETQTYKNIDLTIYPIADSLKAVSERKFDKYIQAGLYLATWFDTKPHDYTLWVDDYYVTFTALFDTTNIEIVTEQNRTGVKQSIILMNDNADTSYAWIIDTDTSMYFSDGITTFKDSMNNFLFRIPSATAWDANKIDIPVVVTLINNTFTYSITVPIDAVYPITIDPSTTVNAENDGTVLKGPASDYATQRDGATGSGINTNEIVVGQVIVATDYTVQRSFLSFPIPNMASCSACSLYLNGTSNSSTDDFDIYIHTSTHSPTIDTGDYIKFDGRRTGQAHNGTILNDTWNSSSWSVDWNDIVFNSAGRDEVVNAKEDTLWIALISKEDFDNSAPTVGEWVNFASSNVGGSEPYLSFTYTIPPDAPANFAIADSATTTLSYTWDDNSGDEDGFFIKNTADTLTVGSFAANATSGTVTGLTPATSYQYFVVAYNTIGESNASGNVTHNTVFPFNTTFLDSINVSLFKTHLGDVDNTYLIVRDAIDIASITSNDPTDSLGQTFDSTNYHVWRSSFDIYGFPWTDSLVSATVRFNLVTDKSTTDFNLQLYEGSWSIGDNEDSHYHQFDGHNVGGNPDDGVSLLVPWNTSGKSPGEISIAFNPVGLKALETTSQAGDTLRLIFISGEDSTASVPTDDEYIIINATARIVFEWQRLSVIPQGMVLTPLTTTTIRASWRDETFAADSISVIRSSDDSVYVSVEHPDTTAVVTGLAINEFNEFKLKVIGGFLDGSKTSAESTWTHAAVPGKVTVSYPSTSEIKIILDINGNPAYTKFAIQDSISGKYVHLLGAGVDDTLRTAVDWNTYPEWGGAAGCTLSVNPAALFQLRSKSRSTNQ